jgi:hypothetical protein
MELTVSHGKVDVEHSHKLGMSLDDLPNAFTSESLFPETSLDLVQDLLVTRLGLVKHCISVARLVIRKLYSPFLRAK